MKLKHFMVPTEKVVKAPSNQSLKDVATLMVNENIGSVVLVDPSNSNRPVGILTKTDLVRESLKSYKNIDLPAESVMSKNLTFAKDYLEEEQVAEAMRSNNIHYVLVEDEQSNWIGMASTVDILEEMAHSNKAFPYNRRRKVEY